MVVYRRVILTDPVAYLLGSVPTGTISPNATPAEIDAQSRRAEPGWVIKCGEPLVPEPKIDVSPEITPFPHVISRPRAIRLRERDTDRRDVSLTLRLRAGPEGVTVHLERVPDAPAAGWLWQHPLPGCATGTFGCALVRTARLRRLPATSRSHPEPITRPAWPATVRVRKSHHCRSRQATCMPVDSITLRAQAVWSRLPMASWRLMGHCASA